MSIKTVAGLSVGKAENEVCRYDDETGQIKTHKVRSRYLYVQKCFRGECEGGIVIPEKSRKDHQEIGGATFCLVLAIGDKCGTPLDMTEEQEQRCDAEPEYKYMMTAPVMDVKVMDRVWCPDTNAYSAIINSPWDKDEFFIRDSLPFAKIEE